MTEQSIGKRKLASQQVADTIARRIELGEFRDGDRLASESDLAREFGVARGTMRSALEILKGQNLVTTKPGVGSFVSYHGHAMESVQGWTRATAQAGSPTTTELIETERIAAPDELRRAYGMQGDVHRIVRRRMSGAAPVSLEISYLPCNEILDLIMERGLLGGSISTTMKAAGMTPCGGVQDATVACVPAQYRSYLDVDEREMFLEVRRISYGEDGEPVEYVLSYLNPRHFSLHVEFGDRPERG
ncbi:GntR family transcriptional regulator [Bifidobacterium platyrrhinorum]|uniref:UTRA domain-containing protein n=1 Tax=Bifidobacterium platyrrhinorum TaxID=2661628 RepID=A0A6L9SNZ3_9BIFI|nr:GntR family transcriptional regulator [Bifidobacterium platyrrhinorum]NEG54257.1 UTRA domain-containing protein [Bifidobacterium platyrrhinorum]